VTGPSVAVPSHACSDCARVVRVGAAGDSGSEHNEDEAGWTASEIADYARRILGLDPVWDTDLMWCASQLPVPCTPCCTLHRNSCLAQACCLIVVVARARARVCATMNAYPRRIAEEGLDAPVPEGWTEHYDEASDRDYYHNASTGETSWQHPLDAHYRELAMSEKAKKVRAVPR
jgi:hypothetical protein